MIEIFFQANDIRSTRMIVKRATSTNSHRSGIFSRGCQVGPTNSLDKTNDECYEVSYEHTRR